jgi:hypothetical protein
MARGNRREPIFLDQEDGKQFVKALGEVCAMTGWRVHAWVLRAIIIAFYWSFVDFILDKAKSDGPNWPTPRPHINQPPKPKL